MYPSKLDLLESEQATLPILATGDKPETMVRLVKVSPGSITGVAPTVLEDRSEDV